MMSSHSQNLNDKGMGVQGPKWVHGRAWWRGDGDVRAHAEWCLGPGATSCGLGMNILGEDYDVQLHVGIPRLFSIWATVGVLGHDVYKRLPKKFSDAVYGGHGLSVFEVSWHDGYLSIRGLLANDADSREDHHVMFEPLAKILGSWKYVRTTIKEVDVDIPMPEGTYPARLVFERCEKRWKRWPWATEVFTTVNVKIGRGADVISPKGLYSSSFPARSVAEAVAKVVEGLIRDRGGTSWRPPIDAVRGFGNAIEC